MAAKMFIPKGATFFCTLNASYHSSFIKLSILVIENEFFSKPDDTLTIDCILQFHSCLLNTFMYLVSMFERLFLFKLGQPILHKKWRKLQTGIFSCVQGNNSNLESFHFNYQHTEQARKKIPPLRTKMCEKKEKYRFCKALSINTKTQKLGKIFENIRHLIMFFIVWKIDICNLLYIYWLIRFNNAYLPDHFLNWM